MNSQHLVTRLTNEAIDDAVTKACRWDSPYFAHGHLQDALQGLHDKIDHLPAEHLSTLAADLNTATDRDTVKDQIDQLAATQVSERLQARHQAHRGWKPLQEPSA